MAYIKIFPIKVTDKKALDYIMNPGKTDEKLLVSSFACSPETADLEFADEVLKGKYEYVISTHVDQNHIHNHIIFNATSFVDHHKYVSNKRSYHKICRISNRICQENGLASSMPTDEKGKSYKENMEHHRGNSWKSKLRATVDKAIWSSISYEEFLQKMKLAGYEIRQGKNLAFRAPEQINFTNMKSLGNYYSEENVLLRLEKNRHKIKTPPNASREVRLYIQMSSYIATDNRAGFEHWAKLNNLKQAALTFNYLSENNLLNYNDFQQHVEDVANSLQAAEQRNHELDTELSRQKIIQKHCERYRSCRKIVEKGKPSSNPKAYKSKHQSEYHLHDTLKQQLQELGITKLPFQERQYSKIANLEKELTAILQEKQDLKKRYYTLQVIQENFDYLLSPNEPDINEKDFQQPSQEI